MRVTVHHFKVYDAVNDSWIVPPRKSPAERIESVRGVIIPGTAEEVERSVLDEQDRYDPRPRGYERPRILN
ncbi:hypothetical protein [uncultured Hyphomicrobium sp.]|uniref:hypothetical protein n=1 Tax=uncultured Hyphomicrobium sp. TaxID=194373 RepID=UPI0025F36FF6|nr:hypothetical protein [uncultured Hyphomicrobium sp.]